MKRYVLILLLLAGAVPLYSQTKTTPAPAERLTNKSIVALHSAGLQPEVIILKIEESACTFNLSTDNLIALKKSGVPDAIIQAMMDKTSSKGIAGGKSATVKRSGNMPAAEMINHPYFFNQTANSLKPLEKSVAGISTKYIALGYGGIKFLYQIPGDQSSVRLSQVDSVAFLINTGGANIPEMTLYKLKREGGGRNAVSMQTKAMGGIKPADNVLAFNVTAMSNGLFKIVPAKKLEPGEYLFAGKPIANATTIDVFAFGID